jgi:hypothetical protein
MPVNPFNPGVFHAEQRLYGRESQIQILHQVVEQISGDYPHRPVCFIGPQGLGKTSILKYIADYLNQLNWLCGYSEVSSDIGSAIYDVLADAQQLAPQKGAVQRILSRIQGFNASVGPASIGLSIASIEDGSAYIRLVELFRTIADTARFNVVGAALLLDEAQVLPGDHLRILLRALNAVDNSPIVLFMAALPSLMDSFALSTYSAPHLEISTLTTFDLADAESLLREPVDSAGGEFEVNGLSQLVNFACGHPLTLQMLGSSAWSYSVAGISNNDPIVIRKIHASRAVADVRQQLKMLYYRPNWRRCVVPERVVLRALAKAGGTLAARELCRNTENEITDPSMIIEDLAGRGILYADETVSFVLPGFCEFVKHS